MSEHPQQLSDVILTPHGLLRVTAEGEAQAWPVPEAASRVAEAFSESTGRGLGHLATRELDTFLPPAGAWWREFGRRYFTRLCHTPGLNAEAEIPPVPAPDNAELGAFADTAPPMRGGEYLTPDLLRELWQQLDGWVRGAVRANGTGAAAWLRTSHPLWHMVGRVTVHLAENKKDPDYPFAFMASYASRLSSASRVQHLPLARALQEYAENKPALLNLLEPLNKAAESSPCIRELVDSGKIFKPLRWTPREAYRLLKDVAAIETAGLIVRLPNWGSTGRPVRPQVKVNIGERRSSGLGADTLLSFAVELTLDGDPLTEAEARALLRSTEGLALVRGKWVQVDAEKLNRALQQWKDAERLAGKEGVNFFEGLRLLAGFNPQVQEQAEPGTADDREWVGVQAGQWLAKMLDELRDPAKAAAPGPIPGLTATLRPYQEVGVNWLSFLSNLGLGGCLADDMGLGKTIQMLAFLLKRKADRKVVPLPSLLVAPASLLANWRVELQRFTPELRSLVVHPSEGKERPDASSLQKADLVMTTYGMLARLEWLRRMSWDVVVLDEAQAIKNPATRQARAVKELHAGGRFALTGTPVENRATDLWSIFDFLNPGLLGSAAAFKNFLRAREKGEVVDYSPLRSLTRPYLLRRLKTDRRIISDLPEKTEMEAWCSLSKQQAALYQQAVRELSEALENASGIQRKGLVLSYILRFKQICNHPSQWLADGGYVPAASGKFGRLGELAETVAERQEKALVFTQYREITDALAGYLAGLFGRPGLVLHGGTAVAHRRELVEAFQRDDGPPFFVLTVKAGGSGLNLTQAAHVIHFDRWWNPAVENQATDRAFRIGQKQNVLVHKFICRGTVEERIHQLLAEKKTLADDLIEGGAEKLLTEMNNAELLQFVSLDLQRASEITSN